MSTGKRLVVVLGAGVVGLHSALSLLQAGYDVMILARHIPGDLHPLYTSPWSATCWAAAPVLDDERMRRWYTECYRNWQALSSSGDDVKRSGVSRREYVSYVENPDPETVKNGAKGFWYHNMVDNFKILSPADLPSGAKFGFSFTSFAVDTPKYLDYLQNSILKLGGQIIRAQFRGGTGSLAATLQAATRTLPSQQKYIHAFVNATGLGAIPLAGDKTMFPLRSQAVWVKGEAMRIVDRLEIGGTESKGEIAIYYACPRVGSGYTVLGGYMEEENWNGFPTSEITKKLMEKNKTLIPELLNENGEFDFISDGVGLRPHRQGGARLEVERSKGTGDKNVVHCYGHSHGGFLKAIGSAKEVVDLVNGLQDTHDKSARL